MPFFYLYSELTQNSLLNSTYEMKLDISARYYIAEGAVWLLGVTLLISRCVGLAPSQPLPLLNVTLEGEQNFLRVVVTLLVAATFYLYLEWKLSPPESRRSYWAKARVGVTTFFSCASLWSCYSLIAANTRFAEISPIWYFLFMGIGYRLGEYVSVLAFATLAIRTPSEARAIFLPRIPAATRAQYRVWVPIVFLLLIAYYLLCYIAPEAIIDLGFFLVAAPFLFIIGESFAPLCFSHDEDGKRIPYAKRLESIKKVFDQHDYAYFLIDNRNKIEETYGIPTKASPEAMQKNIREKCSTESFSGSNRFRVQLVEDVQFQFYFKDGNQDNQLPENMKARIIQKHQDKSSLLRALVIPDDPEKKPRAIAIPSSLVLTYADKYLSTHAGDADLTVQKVFSYAINQCALQDAMTPQLGPLMLFRAVREGKEDMVEMLLEQDVDVNKQIETGWTSLTGAAAQGHPRIVRLLLDAGANPDIGNLKKITPLMFGARYGNIEICRLLLEYGANPDLQDVYGMTALIVSTREGHADIAEMLLKAGASINIKDHENMTALDFAHKLKQGKIARLIRTANKRI